MCGGIVARIRANHFAEAGIDVPSELHSMLSSEDDETRTGVFELHHRLARVMCDATAMDEWLTTRACVMPGIAKLGGEVLSTAIRTALSATVVHCCAGSDEVNLAIAFAEQATSPAASFEAWQSMCPAFLCKLWRYSADLRIWAKSRKDQGIPYSATAAHLHGLSKLLLNMMPSRIGTMDSRRKLVFAFLMMPFRAPAVEAPVLTAPRA